MTIVGRAIAALAALSLVLAALTVFSVGASAQALAQDVPARVTKVIVPYTEYEWWLFTWSENQFVCQVLVDHEGLPTLSDVSNSCGADIATLWWDTPLCKPNKTPEKPCEGLYIFFVTSTPKEREEVIDLPSPTIWIDLEGCAPTPPENLCPQIPTLLFTAEEPLPEHQIVRIAGTYDGTPFNCEGATCRLPLATTPALGVTVEFWAESTYGDTSPHFTAQVRVVDTGVTDAPGAGGYFVDMISSQWRGVSLTSCAQIWEAFPPAGGNPGWLSTPDHFEMMASGEPYYYLAGRLISQGLVDASVCPNNGLLPNGYADACGLETARPLVEDWQNQFDQRTIQVANDTGIPAQLMKNLFAHESQFWPGMYRVTYEFGLGQITDAGTDPIFIWNPGFFHSFCPLILLPEACEDGYLALSPENQAILRGALALQARADCVDCPTGVDLTNVYFTTSLFANTLKANCAQVARTIYTATGEMAGRVATYEDLWRFTIANYHAGPGCTSYAIHQAWQTTGLLNWENVSTSFTEPCQGVVPYVTEIAR